MPLSFHWFSAGIPEEIMFHVFLYGGISGVPLAVFESGMRQAFLASFVATIVAAVISALHLVHSFARGQQVHLLR
ncbi:MAG: hypothetical protein PHY05_13675 [Methanothrix sp.]|nr:hypothetical protein [Methanothrix sp.]